MSGESRTFPSRSTGLKHTYTLVEATEQLLAIQTEAQGMRAHQLVLHMTRESKCMLERSEAKEDRLVDCEVSRMLSSAGRRHPTTAQGDLDMW